MALLNILKFRDYVEANYVLRGGVITGALAKDQVVGLVGATLTFTSPSGNKTFTQPATTSAGLLSFADIKSQLEAAVTNLKVEIVSGCIAFRHATPGSAVTLGSANEPARTALGMPNNTAITGKVYNPPSGAVPRVFDTDPGEGNTIFAFVEE